VLCQVAILEMESELMDLKFQLERERELRFKAEQVWVLVGLGWG